MSAGDDDTKKLLEQLMSELHAKQANTAKTPGETYLEGGDGVFLGNVDTNRYDRNSLANRYGPYGSRYSQTSILNSYSPYGSRYGIYSLRNPHSQNPPKLFIAGKLAGVVSANPRLKNRISTEDFLHALENDVGSIQNGSFLTKGGNARQSRGDSFLEASDGTYLGSLNPNQFDPDSIFNEFGPYGSQFSPTSIFNQYGQYGSAYSQMSPFNEFSNSGPTVYKNGKAVGKLTKNRFVQSRIDPDQIKSWATSNVSLR